MSVLGYGLHEGAVGLASSELFAWTLAVPSEEKAGTGGGVS